VLASLIASQGLNAGRARGKTHATGAEGRNPRRGAPVDGILVAEALQMQELAKEKRAASCKTQRAGSGRFVAGDRVPSAWKLSGDRCVSVAHVRV
jgi:hypothetical protein